MNKRVLVVDHDLASLSVLTEFLEKGGFEVISATSGQAALEIMQRPAPPQLVIADWLLPGMDGPALCRALRAERDLPFCYFIVMTGPREQSKVMTALAAGADDFLSKPARPDEMAARLRLAQRIIDLEADLERSSIDRHPWVVQN